MNQLLIILAKLYAVFILLVGCCPAPHNEYFAPNVSGILVNGNTPLSQAAVYLSAHSSERDCAKYDLITTTDEKGEFKIGPIREFQFLLWFIGDPVVFWDMCVDLPDGRHSILSQGGIGFAQDTLRVRCDISAKTVKYLDAFPRLSGKCESVG